MEKKFKIIILVVIAFIAVVGVGILISAMTAGPTAEMSGETYHEGDYISFKSFNDKVELDTYVTQISEEAMYSETKDGKYTVMWDLKKGSGMLVKYPDDYLYNY